MDKVISSVFNREAKRTRRRQRAPMTSRKTASDDRTPAKMSRPGWGLPPLLRPAEGGVLDVTEVDVVEVEVEVEVGADATSAYPSGRGGGKTSAMSASGGRGTRPIKLLPAIRS